MSRAVCPTENLCASVERPSAEGGSSELQGGSRPLRHAMSGHVFGNVTTVPCTHDMTLHTDTVF